MGMTNGIVGWHSEISASEIFKKEKPFTDELQRARVVKRGKYV
jgi:glycerol-3-phosphate cytidylyltransferase-like family protein